MSLIDIALFVIVGLSVLLGWKRGLIKTLTGLVSLALSLVLAMTLHAPVSQYLKDTSLHGVIKESVASVLSVPEEETVQASDYGVHELNLPRDFVDGIQKNIDAASGNISDAVGNTVADTAIDILSMLVIFFAAKLILHLVTLLAGFLHKLPVIGFGDSLLGGVFGLLRGMLIIYLLLAILTFVASVSPENVLVQGVTESDIAKLMYHHNMILDFIF